MLQKFKTEVVNIAMRARTHMPKDYQNIVERDLAAIVHMYSALFVKGDREILMRALSEVAIGSMADLIASVPPEILAQIQANRSAQPTQSADKCKYCGGAHKSEAH